MSPSAKQDSSEAPLVVGRRSARLSMIIPITIHGTDTGGLVFRENTWTIGVNKQGAKIATFHPLPLGGQISVVNPVLGRSAKARIIWVGEKRFPEDPFEVGVELMEAQNVWGLKFPPEDWQKPTPATTRGHDSAESAAQPATKGAATEAAKSADTPKAAETPGTAPKEGEKDSGASPEKFNQFNLALAALSRFQAEATAGARTEAPLELPAAPPPGPAPEPGGRGLEVVEQKEKSLSSLEEQIRVQANFLEASRGEVQALLRKLQDMERTWQAQMEKAARSLEETGSKKLESSLEESAQQLLDRLGRSFDERARDAERALEAKLGKLEAQIQEASANAGRKVHESCEREVEQVQKIISNRVDWAVDSLNLATGAAAAKLYSAYRKAEADYKALSADYPQKLADLSKSGLESFRQKTQGLLGEFQALLQKTWNEFKEKGAREVTERFRRSADQMLESWAKELDRRAADVLELVTDQLRTSGAVIAEEAKKQVTALNQSTRDALAREARATVETVKTLGEKLGTSGEVLVGETAKQLSAMTRDAIKSLAQETRAISDECRAQTRRVLEEFGQRGPRELEASLGRVVEKHREAMLRELQREADDSTQRALAQIKTRSEQVAREAADTVYKQVGVGAVALRDWADQARSGLQGFLTKSVEDFQKRVDELSQTTLDQHRQGSEVLVDDLRARLQQAARIFEEKGQEKRAEPASGKPVEPAPSAGPDAAPSPDPALERLKKTQEQAVNEAAEAFRTKLAEMMAGFQFGSKDPNQR